MQKSLVFKEKFKHIHHPGQTKYSMSVGIGCLSHLFAGSVPGEGLRGESKNYLFIFFYFYFCCQPTNAMQNAKRPCQAERGPSELGLAVPWAGKKAAGSWEPGGAVGAGRGTRDTFSGRDKDKRDRQGERGPKSCWERKRDSCGPVSGSQGAA